MLKKDGFTSHHPRRITFGCIMTTLSGCGQQHPLIHGFISMNLKTGGITNYNLVFTIQVIKNGFLDPN